MAVDSAQGRKPQHTHTLHLPNPQTRVIRKHQLQELLPISDTTIRRLLAEDPSFPKPIRIGPRAIGWKLAEVERYLSSRPAARTASCTPQGLVVPGGEADPSGTRG